jgi:transcriptional regulatory protein LevR
MSKKTFKDKTNHLDRFFSEIEEIEKTHEPQRTHIESITQKSPKYYRLNLKLKAEYKEYLDLVSWENKKSITQYLNDLIEADKLKKDTKNI